MSENLELGDWIEISAALEQRLGHIRRRIKKRDGTCDLRFYRNMLKRNKIILNKVNQKIKLLEKRDKKG